MSPLPDTNARQPAVTVRPSSNALLTIDSEDRYADYTDQRSNPTSPYNFTIRKNENLMAGFFTRLAVTEINFPFTVPNINRKTDKIGVSYQPAASPIALATITLDDGFATPAEIAADVQAKVRALSTDLSGFTMGYGASYDFSGAIPSFYYNTNNATTIAFTPLPYNTVVYPYPSQTKQLFDLLGFSLGSGIYAGNDSLSTANNGNATLCQAIRYVDIVCNVLTSVSALKDQTSQPIVRDMLCRVYLGDGGGTGQSTVQPDASGFCPPGCAPLIIYRNFTNPKQIQWIPNQNVPGCLQFQVYDDAGDLLENSLPPSNFYNQNTDWSMTILVSEN